MIITTVDHSTHTPKKKEKKRESRGALSNIKYSKWKRYEAQRLRTSIAYLRKVQRKVQVHSEDILIICFCRCLTIEDNSWNHSLWCYTSAEPHLFYLSLSRRVYNENLVLSVSSKSKSYTERERDKKRDKVKTKNEYKNSTRLLSTFPSC